MRGGSSGCSCFINGRMGKLRNRLHRGLWQDGHFSEKRVLYHPFVSLFWSSGIVATTLFRGRDHFRDDVNPDVFKIASPMGRALSRWHLHWWRPCSGHKMCRAHAEWRCISSGGGWTHGKPMMCHPWPHRESKVFHQ